MKLFHRLKNVYVLDCLRIPFGKFGKSLARYSARDLACYCSKELISRSEVLPEEIGMTILGCVLRAGTGMNFARQVSLSVGIPAEVEAFTLDMVCSSGMLSTILASEFIDIGLCDLVLCGGAESMSSSPFLIPSELRWKKLEYGKMSILDSLVFDGLRDPVSGNSMGEIADKIAKEEGISRRELDEVALRSHKRAAEAWDLGKRRGYVVPFSEGGKEILKEDEGIRRDTSLESLSKLKPAFTSEGLHTAGNSSQISDGAALLLLCSKDFLKRAGVSAKARICSWAVSGTPPDKFPYGPIVASKELERREGRPEVWENHQAFALSEILFERALKVDPSDLNLYGESIALGHPLGATGARVIVDLLNVLEKEEKSEGIASVCHGLGGGSAVRIKIE